ncbi:MAG TPA: ribbon-helix-helix domain-containing protein [Thermoplasmataceae archaeon]|nr:ribbon-helix-helix domain-containing protein [Thermoplasmataceae archaeon]
MYRTIRLPKVLVDQVEEKVNSSNLGYHSISQFVSEAIRRQLAEIGGIKPRASQSPCRTAMKGFSNLYAGIIHRRITVARYTGNLRA